MTAGDLAALISDEGFDLDEEVEQATPPSPTM
jgi:hypothetical protein